MLAADPATGEIRCFLVGPRGCEITGMVQTPDLRTIGFGMATSGGGRKALAARKQPPRRPVTQCKAPHEGNQADGERPKRDVFLAEMAAAVPLTNFEKREPVKTP
jgi:secreted PhoX family phosphatase